MGLLGVVNFSRAVQWTKYSYIFYAHRSNDIVLRTQKSRFHWYELDFFHEQKMPNFVHGTSDNKNKTYYTVNHKIMIDTSFLEDVWINDLWIIIKCKYNWDIMSCRSSTMTIYHGLLESTTQYAVCVTQSILNDFIISLYPKTKNVLILTTFYFFFWIYIYWREVTVNLLNDTDDALCILSNVT